MLKSLIYGLILNVFGNDGNFPENAALDGVRVYRKCDVFDPGHARPFEPGLLRSPENGRALPKGPSTRYATIG